LGAVLGVLVLVLLELELELLMLFGACGDFVVDSSLVVIA
jgi:hypothetical protein